MTDLDLDWNRRKIIAESVKEACSNWPEASNVWIENGEGYYPAITPSVVYWTLEDLPK